MLTDAYTDEIAAGFNTTEADVIALITVCGISMYAVDGRNYIAAEDAVVVSSALSLPKYRTKIEAFAAYSDRIQSDHPEIVQYLCYHNVVDVLCWLIKLRYSAKETVQKKRYRLDTLFDAFLEDRNYDLTKVARLVGANSSADKFAFHLKKGWYHELVRSYPLVPDMLNIGTRISVEEFTQGKFLSWNVTQSYYSIYEYISALVFTNTDTARTEQHKATTNLYEDGVRLRLTNTLIPYPFNLTTPIATGRTINSLRQKSKLFWDYKYSACPRSYGKSIYDLEKDLLHAIGPERNLTSFFYDFRVWANYLGIESILEVQNGYLVSYLYRNLGIVCFFYACFAEIMALAFLGETKFIELLTEVAQKFILRDDKFTNQWYLIPVFIRLRFYHKHGLLTTLPSFALPPNPDPISL